MEDDMTEPKELTAEAIATVAVLIQIREGKKGEPSDLDILNAIDLLRHVNARIQSGYEPLPR